LLRPALEQEKELETLVATIISNVRLRGDQALQEYTSRYDGVELNDIRVSKSEIESAKQKVPQQVRQAINTAYEQIKAFHMAQIQIPEVIETMPGVKCSVRIRAMESVGLYVPGGATPLPSTALMLGVPAQLAGCPRTILVSPPDKQGKIAPEVLYAAQKCGITFIYKIGGAQAIAALAYGTDSVEAVDKIFGPGNRFVTMAKQLVSQKQGLVGIDMPAGPSEVLIIADESANPTFVAIDLLSQAEHGPDSQVILISSNEKCIESTKKEVTRLTESLERRSIIEEALKFSRYILVDSVDEAIEVSNSYAPEHLILQVNDPGKYLDDIKHAGSIFLGPWTPESAGDYASGTNHVLPTYGSARFTSSLGLSDFQKRSTIQEITRSGLESLGSTIMTLAAAEGLGAHEMAVALRLKGGIR